MKAEQSDWRVESAASFRVVLDKESATRVSIEVSKYLVSWCRTYLGDLQPTYKGVRIQFFLDMKGDIITDLGGGFKYPSIFKIPILVIIFKGSSRHEG